MSTTSKAFTSQNRSKGGDLQGDLSDIALRVCLPAQRLAVQKSLRHLDIWRLSVMAKARELKNWDSDSLIHLAADVLFNDAQWSVVLSLDVSDWFLPWAIEQRRGSPVLTLMILQELTHDLAFDITPLSVRQPTMARFFRDGCFHYLDLNDPSLHVDENRLLANLLDDKLPDNFSLATHYLEECLTLLSDTNNDALALNIVNYLCESFPRRMDFFAHRAILQHRQGEMPSALKDLRRFFAFYSERKAPRDLVKIYRKLSSHLARAPK